MAAGVIKMLCRMNYLFDAVMRRADREAAEKAAKS
jgi:hypothetical protein